MISLMGKIKALTMNKQFQFLKPNNQNMKLNFKKAYYFTLKSIESI